MERLQRRVVAVPLTSGGRLDLPALADACALVSAAGSRAVLLLCSPHNPTGTVHTVAELAEVARLGQDTGVRVVVDEIHAPLALAGARFTPFLTVPGAERGLAVISAAKGWHLAALKAGLVIAGSGAAADLRRMPEALGYGASHLGLIAGAAAFGTCDAWLDAHRAGLAENRALLAQLLADRLPGVRWQAPAATYLAWLDCRALGWGEDPAETFLARGRVALNPGPSFGVGGAGHVRLNFATSPQILTAAVERMRAALEHPR